MRIVRFPGKGFKLPWSQHNLTVFIVAINVGIFFLALLRLDIVGTYLAMNPVNVNHFGRFWTVFTYMFLHTEPMHLIFNMIALFFIGYEVERTMGSWHYLIFYLLVGLGAGILSLVTYSLAGNNNVWLLGASGAIYGLLLAYACFFPDRRLLVFGIFPIRAPWLVIAYAGIDIVMEMTGSSRGVAHLTHLYGLVLAFFAMLVVYRLNFFDTLRKH